VQVAGGTLDAINKVLSALLAASASSSSASASNPQQPQPVSEAPSPTAAEPASQEPASKKSFLKVIDHQNQPAAAANRSVEYSHQSRGRLGDPDYRVPRSSSTSATADDYRQRLDARLVADSSRDRSDLRWQRADDAGRYVGRTADSAGYRSSAGDIGVDRSQRYSAARHDRSSEFWNEMSAYCNEYEARVSRRDDDDVTRGFRLPPPPTSSYLSQPDVRSYRLPRPPTVDYATETRIGPRGDVDSRLLLRAPPAASEYDQRRAVDSGLVMSDQRRCGDVVDSSRRRGSRANDIDERQLRQLYEELRRTKDNTS